MASRWGTALGVTISVDAPSIIWPLLDGLLSKGGLGVKRLHVQAYLGPRGQWKVSEGSNASPSVGCGLASLHYAIDKVLTLGLQRQRPDLLFLHAAVFVNAERAVALLGCQGSGKSTTALAALDAGLRCYSDELAPIHPDTLRVWPYARALVLKHRPARMSTRTRLRATRLGQRWYVPLRTGFGHRYPQPRPLQALVLLERSGRGLTRLETIEPSRAMTHVYSHCLNPLAHAHGGLPAVRRLVSTFPCYRLESADPQAAVGLICQLLRSNHHSG